MVNVPLLSAPLSAVSVPELRFVSAATAMSLVVVVVSEVPAVTSREPALMLPLKVVSFVEVRLVSPVEVSEPVADRLSPALAVMAPLVSEPPKFIS